MSTTKSILVILTLGFFSVAGFACAAPVDPGDGTEDIAEEVPLRPQSYCCRYGSWYCPNSSVEYAYSNTPSVCGESLTGQARIGCNNHCSVACVDTGYGSCIYQ